MKSTNGTAADPTPANRALAAKQYRLFVSGKGVGGDPAAAKLVDQSVRILINTTGNPLYANVNGRVTPTGLAATG